MSNARLEGLYCPGDEPDLAWAYKSARRTAMIKDLLLHESRMATQKVHAGEKHDFALGDLTPQYHNHEILPDAASSDIEIGQRATNISLGEVAHLPQEHRDYLISRHGTLDLDPIPSADPADPYNCSSSRGRPLYYA